MLRRLSLTLKDQKDVKRAEREVRGAAVPYHEPTTSTDDEDNDVDDDASMSTSPRAQVRSWPSTPSTPTDLPSTLSPAGRLLSPPPLELSARTLLTWSGSLSSSPSSPPPLVYLPQSRGVGRQLIHAKQQSISAMAESGDVYGLKEAFKVDANSVNDTDEVQRVIDVLHTTSPLLLTVALS